MQKKVGGVYIYVYLKIKKAGESINKIKKTIESDQNSPKISADYVAKKKKETPPKPQPPQKMTEASAKKIRKNSIAKLDTDKSPEKNRRDSQHSLSKDKTARRESTSSNVSNPFEPEGSSEKRRNSSTSYRVRKNYSFYCYFFRKF